VVRATRTVDQASNHELTPQDGVPIMHLFASSGGSERCRLRTGSRRI
jgi:hypothetical protein